MCRRIWFVKMAVKAFTWRLQSGLTRLWPFGWCYAERLDKKQTLVLRGRLAFCNGFIFRRLRTPEHYGMHFLHHSILHCPALWHTGFWAANPKFGCEHLQTVSLTDVWIRPSSFFPNRCCDRVFPLGWLDVPALGSLLTDGQQTVIGELDLVVVIALIVWLKDPGPISLRQCSKFALIKGYSRSGFFIAICALAATSQSNLADFPSRLTKHPLLREES